ncbi:hypothetical protein [Maricaulis sp.]|jgi:hypothetical protein|uniref:hypothetical protein n=1 Tax=Maricaulis sp. TaxID=1486257 RepID=UPI00262A3963|nr:hypothetical protein [Maricaulis sp.]MDF1769855.1 hypothetical protein [Maricaulis sp.]
MTSPIIRHQAAIKAGRKTRRNKLAKREPNGRIQREHGPDRGTDQGQARREAITGDRRRPVDLADPIDILHRGQIKHLTDEQAAAAHVWRAKRHVSMCGLGPALAERREDLPPGDPMPDRKVVEATEVVERINQVLARAGGAVAQQCRMVVIDQAPATRLDDLRTGLNAIASELGIV